MKPLILFFASRRYWPDEAQLQNAFETLSARYTDAETRLITDEAALSQLPKNAYGVLVPLSGAVQRLMLDAGSRLSFSALYVAYAPENVGEELAALCLARNAAPALMDCWGVKGYTANTASASQFLIMARSVVNTRLLIRRP